jgi:hypothetical protein
MYYFFDQKLPFTYPQRTSKLRQMPSALKREHPALQNKLNFFLFSWVIFALLDPDPEHWVELRFLSALFLPIRFLPITFPCV